MAGIGFDVFCRVVDNYGDIGVCWRLAKQLAALPGQHRIRLWVDDLNSFGRIESGLDPRAAQQRLARVDVVHWTSRPPRLEPLDVVIEAFACDPPTDFIQRMAEHDSLWVNLEYLSAESWVESCHAMPSLQANGLRKIFFFPGFTEATGGLLREPALLSIRDEWRARPALRETLLQDIGLPNAQRGWLRQGARQIFLFGYPNAPAAGLAQAIARQWPNSVVLVPEGVCTTLARGLLGNTYIHEMPFVDQARLDHILWSSDLNCVRGEDSLLRAIWAGRPLLWQLYPQSDDAHLTKLEAWMQRSSLPPLVKQVLRDWNTGEDSRFTGSMEQAMQAEPWEAWQLASEQWCNALAGQTDLAQRLVHFCAKKLRKG